MRLNLPVLLLISVSSMQSDGLMAQGKKVKLKASENFTIEQLAPNVWVAIHNDNYGKAICNAGIVDLGDKTIVFDPFMTPSAALELHDIAMQLTKRNYAYVVNSHYHNDHIRGNQSFLPNATIISTNTTREQIERNEPGEQEWEKKHAPTLLQAIRKRMVNANEMERAELPYWIGYYEGILESSDQLFTSLADETFDDSMWIVGKNMNIKLVERKNGHTISDAVMLLPDLGIAFMGDLLCTDRHPWLSDGNVDSWRSSLKLFYEDTLYTTYLPGHGKVCGKQSLKVLYDYLSDVQNLCNNAQTDSAQAELMNQPIPDAYKGWFCGRFYQPNLQFLISVAKARRLD
ncbi:MAG TPA: MBL fold metallo-hydrolase [Flavitalea sp.]|nr:MBL fold metallo-hydrolase [Flavitalea sp.]